MIGKRLYIKSIDYYYINSSENIMYLLAVAKLLYVHLK